MAENIILIGIGACILIIGILNFFGYIETVHSYNRRRITEENRKPYGRAIGTGTAVIGASLVLSAALDLILNNELVYFGILIGIALGLAFILFAQFKYNKGIF